MANPVNGEMSQEEAFAVCGGKQSRKEKRKVLKKLKRKQARRIAAIREREMAEFLLNDPEEQLLLRLREQEEADNAEKERREYEERERVWLEAAAARKSREEEDERRKKLLQEEERKQNEHDYGAEGDVEHEYVDEGPAEIIWQGNEIIVKKRRVKVAKKIVEQIPDKEDDDRPTSNTLPPQSATFASYVQGETITAQEIIDSVAQKIPNFGTEQDKAHCPFHLKTGACRFGSRCSRVHFYPEKSSTLLIKNMYNGPGLTCEQDEGLEYTDEEVDHSYEEFYEDVHTEFLKFGEIVNFKVCKNSSYHLRGNLYVHYKSLESAILAFNTMNARYYGGKQIICEFVGVTRWKVAICGEYMKTRLKTCSHGSACNFIHCFRNPGGDYEWADWDNPPPTYWIKRMIFLFGTSVESGYGKELDSEDYKRHREQERMRKPKNYRHQSERFHYKEMDLNNSSSDGEELNSKKLQQTRYSTKRDRSIKRRGRLVSENKNELLSENHRSEERFHSKSFFSHCDDAGECTSKEAIEGSIKKHRRYVSKTPEHDRRDESENRSSSSRRKIKLLYSDEKENSEPKSHKKQKKNQVKDRHLENSDWDSFRSKDQFNEECISEDPDSEKDSDGVRYHYSKRRKYDKHRSHRSHKHRYITDKVRKGGEESDGSPGRWKVSEEDFSR
ncbi:zinc finger CCCH domain-containing protein 5 isoform X1 [Dendrobium catenatum]|uniref:zinc finger CCCH domain-containing protein 5 isoform X1 n=1 Tax=Dendrobium catenatum TaxID=906689 RepID=UPI0009F3C4E6|nr:zinc finger CCCH domain-containing protein 5 isoform X1 [Dendrobium catenatum]